MEEIKTIVTIFAIIISIISLYISVKNTKRQIRIGKLEEIIEGILYLSQFYTHLRIFSFDLKEIHDKMLNNEDVEIEQAKLSNEIKIFEAEIDKNKIQLTGARLNVLTNAYLPNGALKNRILGFSHLINILFSSVTSQRYFVLDQYYKEGIPSRKRLGDFLIKIENDLIKEMNLGFSSLDNEKFKRYRDQDFKKEIGII